MVSPTTTLLVYDDDDQLSGLTESVAADLGALALHADSKEGLLESLATPVACLLLNISMPGFDGFEVINYLYDQRFTAPIILLGRNDDQMLPMANKFGNGKGLNIAGVVLKPLSRDVLQVMLDHALATSVRR